MPDTITAYYNFGFKAQIPSADMNENFKNHRGTLLPLTESLAAGTATAGIGTNGTYDLGSTDYRWKDQYLYGGISLFQQSAGYSFTPSAGSFFLFNSEGVPTLRDSGGNDYGLGLDWQKYSLTFGALNSATTTVQGAFYTAPSKAAIHGIVGKLVTNFTGGSIGNLYVSIGTENDDDKYYYQFDLKQGVTNSAYFAVSVLDIPHFNTTTELRFKVTSSSGNLDSLTAGEIEIQWLPSRLKI